MKLWATLLIIIFTLPVPGKAQHRPRTKSDFEVSLNALYSQKRVFRGALIWDAPTLMVLPSFDLFNMINIGRGGALAIYRQYENHRFSIGIRPFEDNGPSAIAIKLKNSNEDFKNQRSSSLETSFQYEYRLRPYFRGTINYHKELIRHYGNYLQLGTRLSPFPLTNIGVVLGIGDREHNKYVYGPEGSAGLGHTDFNLGLRLPFLPWHGQLILNLRHSIINKIENFNADYIRGQRKNSILSIMATWRL